ncbi:zinc finger protein 69-like [Pristis pectinata]|uniref:zinc finger protein 69-like n=1 Tax=Pristis pectinata TaxID=685728 RepID=UPI00223D8342|nr:zinc finger protein 69-like [Pristis pectinata]
MSRKVRGACLAKIKTRLQTARLSGAINSSRKLPHPQTRLVHVNGRKKRQENDAKSDHCTTPCQWTKVKTNGSQQKSASGTSNVPLEAIDLSYDIHNNARNSSNLLTSLNVEYSPAPESSQPNKSRKESREASVLITQDLAGAGDNILDGKRVRCEGCKKLLTYTRFLSHQVSAGEESFNCDVCEKLFNYSCQLSQHQKTHHSKKLYQCDQCGKQLRSMEKLRDHVAYHGEARPHQCNLCDKAYKVKNDLTQHIRVKHMEASKGKPPLVQLCEFCGQAVKHYKSHKIFCSGIKKFQCKFCLQAFYRLSELKRHTWTHTGELPYQCRVCGKRCRHPSNLKKHIRTVHKEEIRVQIDKEHASPKLLKDFLPQEIESNQLIMGKMELGNGSFLNITESSAQLGGSAPSTKSTFTTAVAVHGTVPSMSHALCTTPVNSNAIIPSMHTSLPTALQQHHKVASPLPSFKSLLTSPHVDMLQNSFHQKT